MGWDEVHPSSTQGTAPNRGLIESVQLLDRLRVCPDYDRAHTGFIDVCPNCHAIDIREETFLHCYTCGNVAPQAEYLHGGGSPAPSAKPCYAILAWTMIAP